MSPRFRPSLNVSGSETMFKKGFFRELLVYTLVSALYSEPLVFADNERSGSSGQEQAAPAFWELQPSGEVKIELPSTFSARIDEQTDAEVERMWATLNSQTRGSLEEHSSRQRGRVWRESMSEIVRES